MDKLENRVNTIENKLDYLINDFLPFLKDMNTDIRMYNKTIETLATVLYQIAESMENGDFDYEPHEEISPEARLSMYTGGRRERRKTRRCIKCKRKTRHNRK